MNDVTLDEDDEGGSVDDDDDDCDDEEAVTGARELTPPLVDDCCILDEVDDDELVPETSPTILISSSSSILMSCLGTRLYPDIFDTNANRAGFSNLAYLLLLSYVLKNLFAVYLAPLCLYRLNKFEQVS